MSVENVILNISRKPNKGETKWQYQTQLTKVTGVIEEIIPQANGNVRVKLMVEGKPRYTTWTSK
jgi:hypothetical protein